MAVIIFLFGLAVGSFLNCVIYRLAAPEGRASPSGAGRETNQSFLKGRSFCPHCKHILGWRDLIPVLSFIWLRGKCRYCKEKISWQYPIVNNYAMAYLLTLVPFLVAIFVYDLKHRIIPDKVIYPAIGITLVYDFLRSDLLGRSDLLISAFGAAAFFAAIVFGSRGRWMGAGDIKLAFLMGLILGYPNILVALFLAFVLGAIMGVGLIAFGRKTIKSEVPFGPFLVAGTLIALFWGEKIINWYAEIFRFYSY
jgi:leader peptidase (prepilin peptidase) / N-methyltransferase